MSPKLEVQAYNMEVTDRIREYVTKKTNKLERFLPAIEDIRVELTHARTSRSAADRYVAQITVRGKQLLLRSEEREGDVRAAFDEALEKMERQIRRFKGKRYRGRGDGRSAAEVVEPIEDFDDFDDEEEDESTTVVRRKKFVLIPMNEAEAIEQMQLLGHNNFFIFFDADANKVKVLYRRRDGDLGLIEPEIG
ncbi:MAG: ribosome-associated translation inhibitor RaiA [Anaerolineales bacterium]